MMKMEAGPASPPPAASIAVQQHEELMTAGLAFFDRLEASVETPYPAAAVQRASVPCQAAFIRCCR